MSAGVTFAAAFFIDHGRFTAFRAELADLVSMGVLIAKRQRFLGDGHAECFHFRFIEVEVLVQRFEMPSHGTHAVDSKAEGGLPPMPAS